MIDTNILLEGLTSKGSAGDIVDAWAAKELKACVSTALALEYEEVLAAKLGEKRQREALAALQALLSRAEFVPILTSVRPMSPDPDDDFVIDCAFNAGAPIVTRNVRDFRDAEALLRIVVLTPEAFLDLLRST